MGLLHLQANEDQGSNHAKHPDNLQPIIDLDILAICCLQTELTNSRHSSWVRSASVKDYQMPAIELGLADYLGVWGRRQIILIWPFSAIECIVLQAI